MKIKEFKREVKLSEINEKDYFVRFIEALTKVSPQYNTYIDSSNKSFVKRAERVYAYELYHQYRKLMEEDKLSTYYLNGEIYKSKKVFNAIDGHNCCPDLVLHHSLEKIEEDSQYFLCEIKFKNNPKLLGDLIKLTNLSKSDLGFKYYIFLCVNYSMCELTKKILKKQKKDGIELNEKIMCVCVDDDNIEFCRLNDIIK